MIASGTDVKKLTHKMYKRVLYKLEIAFSLKISKYAIYTRILPYIIIKVYFN